MKRIAFVIFSVALLFSCGRDRKADISDIHAGLVFKNLDDDLLSPDIDLKKALPGLQKKYASFFPFFTRQMIGIGGPGQPDLMKSLELFVTDTLIKDLKKNADRSVNKDSLKGELEKAFRYYRYYFPQGNIPEIYTCISGFHQSVIYTDSLIGISLDKYLGADCAYYPRLGIPRYKSKNMYPDKIVPDVVYAWGMEQFPFEKETPHLVDRMIYEGKLLFFMSALLPDLPDTVKLGYTKKQLRFCQEREKEMWAYLAEYKLLFSTDRMDVKRYVDDAANTPGFTSESPGRAGVWLGWQIVESYMKQNPGVSLFQLMHDDDYQGLLQHSAYQP